MNKTIIYIGGYKSGGYKISILKKKLNCDVVNISPDYDTEDPKDIQYKIITAINNAESKGNLVEIIGSSTGGMTALLLSQKYNIPMFLINPLIAKKQFFNKDHPVGPLLKPISEILLKNSYPNNKITIYLGLNDELLNPNFTKEFAVLKGIKVITFDGDHAGNDSIDMIIKNIKNT